MLSELSMILPRINKNKYNLKIRKNEKSSITNADACAHKQLQCK